MSQYNWKYRVYSNRRKLSSNFRDVCPKKVNIYLHPLMWYPHTNRQTPFREVRLQTYQDSAEFRTFLRSLTPKKRSPKQIWAEFKQAIFENWMTDKIHLIGASSGYDSRLIAKAVKELHQQHPGWLGETYFVECAGEAEGFTEIMRTLGWTNTIVWEPDFSFEYFENLHRRFNGLCAYPMNQWYDFYKKNWNEEDIQYISGYGGNVTDCMNPNSPYKEKDVRRMRTKQRLRYYFQHNYYYQISAFRQPKYSFHPFWSWRYIRATSGCDHDTPRTSVLLSDLFVPECEHVKRVKILGEVTKNGHRTVKQSVNNKLYDWYRSTTYGKRFDSKPANKIEYNKWWLDLCIANYAEANNISFY